MDANLNENDSHSHRGGVCSAECGPDENASHSHFGAAGSARRSLYNGGRSPIIEVPRLPPYSVGLSYPLSSKNDLIGTTVKAITPPGWKHHLVHCAEPGRSAPSVDLRYRTRITSSPASASPTG